MSEEQFECKGVIAPSTYIEPHQSTAKYRVIVNDQHFTGWQMCGRCYGIYQEEMGINNTIQEVMKQEDLEGMLQEAGEEE